MGGKPAHTVVDGRAGQAVVNGPRTGPRRRVRDDRLPQRAGRGACRGRRDRRSGRRRGGIDEVGDMNGTATRPPGSTGCRRRQRPQNGGGLRSAATKIVPVRRRGSPRQSRCCRGIHAPAALGRLRPRHRDLRGPLQPAGPARPAARPRPADGRGSSAGRVRGDAQGVAAAARLGEGALLPQADRRQPVALGAAAPQGRRHAPAQAGSRTNRAPSTPSSRSSSAPRWSRHCACSRYGSGRRSCCGTTRDLSEADIAKAMGISRGAVKSHTARAMATLRSILEQETP